MKNLFAKLVLLFASAEKAQLIKTLELRDGEISMLRARVPKQRIFLSTVERERLLELGEGIGPNITKLISIVSPRTYKRWLSRKRSGEPRAKKMGRQGTSETLRQIVVRLAKQNQWGYGRIVGELKKLRIQCVGRTNVHKILKEEGVSPSPNRRKGNWDEFVRLHAQTLWQCDFFSKMVVTPTGLKQAIVLAFLHVESRRVICSPATFKADDAWVTEQAESMLRQAKEMELPVRYLVRDQDFKYSKRFDEVFEQADVAVEPTAPRVSNQNAFVERWIGSIRQECLSRFIALGLTHFDFLVRSYLEHYHDARPHQRKENKPLLGVWSDLNDPPDLEEQIVCVEALGGVLKHYRRSAA
ncbi:MAG: transposase [Myxococcales bacterium]|nr:transposase [Myxococcales bacterium]